MTDTLLGIIGVVWTKLLLLLLLLGFDISSVPLCCKVVEQTDDDGFLTSSLKEELVVVVEAMTEEPSTLNCVLWSGTCIIRLSDSLVILVMEEEVVLMVDSEVPALWVCPIRVFPLLAVVAIFCFCNSSDSVGVVRGTEDLLGESLSFIFRDSFCTALVNDGDG